MDNVYFGEFVDREDVERQFEVSLNKGVEILYASYDCPPYEGYAFVLFMENGQLFEVNASHCSCYGLEGQWGPELTSVKSLKYTMEHGRKFAHTSHEIKPLEDVLQRLEREAPIIYEI